MKVLTSSEDPLAPAVIEMFEEAQERVARRLSHRERLVEAVAALAFLAVAAWTLSIDVKCMSPRNWAPLMWANRPCRVRNVP